MGGEVAERIDQYGDRPGARLCPEKGDDAFDLVDLAAIPPQACAVQVGDARFQLRSVELPPLDEFAQPGLALIALQVVWNRIGAGQR
ncbi:hypothetical protein VQ02_12685 [Methylobacterium variabile]|uniref:Uncharacterized protein n=1 Tax=Methylobacterium variabile TaxID=298794 RepID=A0A0J6SVQ1_9HYPH|nr:hypothetical protein VQ02_12685 [Methylobacterium variabile]